jgi:hypothetical protein
MTDADRSFIARLFAVVLSVVVLAMVFIGLIGVVAAKIMGLPVDGSKVVEILGPSYQTIIGCAIGFLSAGGMKLPKNDPPAPPAPGP